MDIFRIDGDRCVSFCDKPCHCFFHVCYNAIITNITVVVIFSAISPDSICPFIYKNSIFIKCCTCEKNVVYLSDKCSN